jgi:hypothetical protein
MTANNVTYGAVGDMVGYWNFFPARDGWGRIPVWGFGEIVASAHDALSAGERIYGYLPISTHVVLQADHVTPGGFVDAAPHRAALPPIYNQYTRVAADPGYDAAGEGQLAIFRPLFTTAFLLDDFFGEQGWCGAKRAILSSASSKTALGLAFLLHRNPAAPAVVGLTSAGNADFVRRTGYYDEIVGYDAVDSLAPDVPSVFVDFAGNAAVQGAIHRRLDAKLAYSSQVGLTHWEAFAPAQTLPGPQPVFFFAPDQARKRIEEWGGAELQRRVGAALRDFLASSEAWLRVVEGRGPRAIEAVYLAMVEGRANPAEGHVLSFA